MKEIKERENKADPIWDEMGKPTADLYTGTAWRHRETVGRA